MKKEKITLREKYWRYLDKHPKVEILLDSLDDYSNRYLFIHVFICVTIFVGIPVLTMFFLLPTEIRGEVSTIIGAVLSVVVMPLAIHHYNHQKEITTKRFEKNGKMYLELAEIIVTILVEQEDVENNTMKAQQYIQENYSRMCIAFSSSLMRYVYRVYRNCKNGNNSGVKYFGEKCLQIIRREGGMGEEFQFYSVILETMRENNEPEPQKTGDGK